MSARNSPLLLSTPSLLHYHWTLPLNTPSLQRKVKPLLQEVVDAIPSQRRKRTPLQKTSKKRKRRKTPEGGLICPLSRMQEKLRKRLSHNFKNKELMPEQARERSSDKYWSPSPRIKILDGTSLVDGRFCPLVRTSSMRHGPPKDYQRTISCFVAVSGGHVGSV